MSNTMIAPSILSADFAKMGEEIKRMEAGGADLIHVDVMDGVFVPNITFGMKMVSDIRKITNMILDVHLMIVNPEKYVEEFAKAGADFITFHIEASGDNATEILETIKRNGKKCGIVISPDTEVEKIEKVLPLCDMVLVMSVYPGFGGQSFIERVLEKVETLKELREKYGYSYLIEIDGGISEKTIGKAKQAGAEVFVAGSAVFSNENAKLAIEGLKKV